MSFVLFKAPLLIGSGAFLVLPEVLASLTLIETFTFLPLPQKDL